MNRLRAATITVAEISRSVACYAEWFGYRVAERGRVAPDLASSWGAPANAYRDFAVLAPASGTDVFLRFIESDPVPGYRPLRNFGWAAVELCVMDVHALETRLKHSPFTIIGPARRDPALPTIIPMQVRGPDGEVVYLTEIVADLEQYDLPRAATPVDRLFIVVLACRDMAASGSWFGRHLGLSLGRAIEMRLPLVAETLGLAADRIFRLCTMTQARDICLELDQYPETAASRPQARNALRKGSRTFHKYLTFIDKSIILSTHRSYPVSVDSMG